MKRKKQQEKSFYEIRELRYENRELKRILRIIFSAKTFKAWQFYCYIRDHVKKLFSDKNNFTFSFVFLYKKIRKIIKEKSNPFIVNILPPKAIEKFNNVSIVIPTYNGAHYFPSLIKAIKMQSHIIDPEIIFVDSESTDETIKLANYYHIKVIKIKKNKFNHGLARNLGAMNSKGKYIIFTVQDALPIDNFTYANMLSTLTNNKNVIGVSTKQTPYPDADLFAKWQMYNHNTTLELNDTNFISSLPKKNKFYQLPFIEKRKISIYDDVCSCVKKDDFFKLGGYKKINFAEDIEFSIRALMNGYKIAFTGNSGVIHSHNRPAEYFFRRYYADNKIVNDLFKEKYEPFFQSLEDILQNCYTTYFYIYKYFDDAKFRFSMPDFQEFTDNIKVFKKNGTPKTESQMLEIIYKFSHDVNVKINKHQNYHMINQTVYEQFKSIYNDAAKLIPMNQYDTSTIEQFCDKLFTTIIGSHLTMFASKNKETEKKLDIILMKGV